MTILYFYGNDPARDQDYHSLVIHGLDTSLPNPIPMLKDVYRFKGRNYLEFFSWMFTKVFKKMPVCKFYTDATRDPTFAELITNKLGSHTVNSFKFTQDSKLKLKLTTRQYLTQGYKFPDVDRLLRENRITADKAFLIREIKGEALREQMKPTSGDRVSFDHGGAHNDLLHGFELSLQGVMDYQKHGFGKHGSKVISAGELTGNAYGEEDIARRFQDRFSKYSNNVKVKVSFD